MKEVKLCAKCILPETLPDISFNEQGVCHLCAENQSISLLGEAKLEEILHSKKGESYDCVVPLSGGKDSTYILYYVTKVLNLRAVAVNYDSAFQADMAIENMKNICAKLNVPLIVNHAGYKLQEKMLKEMMLVSETVGSFHGVCGNCGTNIKTSAINTAKKYKVPFVFLGGSKNEDYHGAGPIRIRKLLTRVPKRTALKILLHFSKYFYLSTRQRMQMKVPLKYRLRPWAYITISYEEPSGTQPRFINFWDYMEWDPLKITKVLEEQLGWKHPGAREGRFDCLLHPLVNHAWLQAYGISADGLIYANLVRSNRFSREDAILRENSIKGTAEKDCREVIEKLGLKPYKMPVIKAKDA